MPEETSKPKQIVAVQKDISLATGESIGMFTRKISEAGTKWVKQKLNLGAGSASCYPVEIFSKSVIFSVYVYTKSGEDYTPSRYYAAAYSRNKDGAFEFSTLTEVEQVVGYQPKDSAAAVTKSKDGGDSPGWQSIAKSFWNGVL